MKQLIEEQMGLSGTYYPLNPIVVLRDHFPTEQLIGITPYSDELLEVSLNTGSDEYLVGLC